MEEKPAQRARLLSNGLGVSTFVLILCGLTGVSSNQVVVQRNVNAVLGKNITLSCIIEVGSNLSLTQSSWERNLPSGTITLAVFNPVFGTSYSPDYGKRISFVSPSQRDATITLEGVGFADVGSYTCKVATFPLGNTQASTFVNVLVEPKVYVSAGSTPLLEGRNESLVAICIAERGRPEAEVSWESDLSGQSVTQTHDDANGTTSVQVSYMWRPQSYAQGKTLTCVVRHPALQTEFKIPYTLNVQFAPIVSVEGKDRSWYVGQKNVKFTCDAKANPPAQRFTWIRLDGPMPDGVEISNNILAFTRPLKRNDSAIYRCEVMNKIGLRGEDVNFWVQGSGEEPSLEISENVTAVLGEDVYLSCRYLGESQIQSAEWKRQTSKSVFERLAGFSNDSSSYPESVTNLTVQVKVSSVEAEGEYICEFKSEDEFFSRSVFVSVLGRPDVQILVREDVINNTSYQSVTCFADGGRPQPQISWVVGSLPPSGYPFTVSVRESLPSNGLFNLSSVLRFPTHLQDEDNVTCVIQHPTLPHPKLATVRVKTYTRPNVTIKAEMVQQRGNYFWVVSCISSGGRPDTDISLAPNATVGLQAEKDSHSDVQRLSVHLPAAEYDGRSLTCMFSHPKFSHPEERITTLPTFYLHKVETDSSNFQDAEYLELQEGETDVISLHITSNVPRYSVICTKNNGPLPEDVELIGQNLTFLAGVKPLHAGLYECHISYLHLNAVLRFNVTVKPRPLQAVPPTISVGLRSEDGRWVMECVAAEAVPAANVSWLVSQSVSEEFWFNSSSYNGSHTVRGVLLVPFCSPWELTAKCVIHHPAFELPENRSIRLPLCARPNITINTSTEWKDGRKYTKVCCSVISIASAADIRWLAEDNNNISNVMQTELLSEGVILAWSFVDLPSSLFSGQNITCAVKHPSLETPAERTIHIPEHKPPLLSVTVMRQRDPPLWQAVCDCEGECFRTNLHWVLPKRARPETPPLAEFEDNGIKATLTYPFPLALHEGQNLTCMYQFDHRISENRTVQIPKYYITSVKILNHSSLLSGRHSDQRVVFGLRVQKNHLNQRILLGVEGNVPEYSLRCQRSDGSTVEVDESAMILQDEGLYSCRASFYHHTASMTIQVEVTDEDEQFMQIMVICISSVTAVLLILGVVLLVFCKKDKTTKYKEQESVAALTSLMQEPGSPEVKKPGAAEDKGIAQLDNYSIVLDVKSAL
ncbi:uncharacterized protein si:ch211-149e23.4 isoform X1 [Oryzias latipes]|uniref:Nectin cell adhesion molecule 3 n=1 Tax=Oryzias latipes TaxID=8090 RepID=A0A3B3H7S9_ORYLA